MTDFIGAKIALFMGDDLAVILRDDKSSIPWPAHWDVPGGGREGTETPLGCALRETHEELGLALDPGIVRWGKAFAKEGRLDWFFVGFVPARAAQAVRFGDEGQRWALMSPSAYAAHPKRIPHFAARVRMYMDGVPSDLFERPPARGGGR
ncbi:MAG: NUDIX hydrolase [Pseudomonadota bacterium]